MMLDHLLFIDLIHRGTFSRISKALTEVEQKPVIVKQVAEEQRSKAANARLNHEYNILKLLNITGVNQPIELRKTGPNSAIIFPHISAISLRAWVSRDNPSYNQRLQVAIKICAVIGQIHEAQIIHKQISPDNILIDPSTLQVWIIDFSLSSQLKREHPSSHAPLHSKQNLIYIAPEQTGRINRVVDYRSDYYALGATLYQLFTDKPPFESTDNVELIHCHLARQPVEPYIHNTGLPEPLSQIIMKLLAKDASLRYQSNLGLCNDLKTCLKMDHSQKVEHFKVGQEDISERFEIPQKLYGRESTIQTLKDSFNLVTQGQQTLTLISGTAGTGKSSLAHEIRHHILQHHGFFAAGKFDQYHRNRPYTAIYQALQTLIRQLLTESDDKVTFWKEALLAATGNNAQVLFQLIPELELILGQQPLAAKLSPSEEQHRFSHTIRQILKVFATKEHPLVLFFDDLHWADLSSLKLLDKLSHNPQHPHLLIIGSYRTQNPSNLLTSTSHPFNLAIEHLKQAPIKVHTLEIMPLALNDVNHLISDALNQSKEESLALAEICFNKTQGNPFFLNQFLLALYEKKLISFQGNQWHWDITQVNNCGITDNVVEFMVDRLQRLPSRTVEILKVAACIGNPVQLHVLANVCKQAPAEVANQLWQALTEGLILPLGASHHYDPESQANRIRYRFIHDRVQQAAYSLINRDDLPALHYQIGHVLKASVPARSLGRRLFDITNHLNQSLSLIDNSDERTELAELNLKTGIRARQSAAFESAFDYFHQGLTLLENNNLKSGDLLSSLQKNAADTAYIKADFDYLDKLLDQAIPLTENLISQVHLEELRIQALVAQNQFSKALEVAIKLLKQLKVPLPLEPSNSTIAISQAKVFLLLKRYSDKKIINLPVIKDPEKLAAMSLLANMFGVVKFSSSGLRPLVMAKEVELTLCNGLSEESAMAFAGYGGVLCGKYQQIEQGIRLGQLALELSELFSGKSEHKPLYLYNAYIRHYKDHLKLCANSLHKSHLKALESGDIEWSAYSLAAYVQYEFTLTPNLTTFAHQLKQYTLQLNESGQKQSLHYTLMTQQAVEALSKGDFPANLNGKHYNEDLMLTEYRNNTHKTAICLHFYYKGILAFIYHQHKDAETFFNEALEYHPYISGTYASPYLSFFSTLNTLILIEQSSILEQVPRIKKAKQYLKTVARLEKHCHENHHHHWLIIKAMILTVEGKYSSAIDYFDQAIVHTLDHGFVLDHAINLELVGHCYGKWGKDTLFKHYIKQAHEAYTNWGALSKQKQLEQEYPFVCIDYTQQEEHYQHSESSEQSKLSSQAYDINSVIKASQAISDEIMLEPLISTLLKLAIINAGAQRAVLLFNHEVLSVAAESVIEEDTRFYDNLPLNRTADMLPSSIIHYVARTKENVVLGNATQHEMFQQDPYIRVVKPLSLLALPILYHGELTAILYLENNQSSNIFDRNRLETLQVLASQAAISIENAKLYQSLEKSEYDFKSLFLNAVEGIFRASPDGRFISANPALASLLNFKHMDEFHNEITDIASQCFYDDIERITFLSKLDKDHKVINFETRWRKKGGDPIYVSISARKVLDASGEVQYYEGSLTDISERKAKEVAEQARYEAEAENEAKSMFLATMSHEIRTPMNGILGMAQLMKKGDLNPTQNTQVETIYNAGQSLLSILNNILDYSKVESGQLDLESKPFWVQQVLDETYRLFMPVAEEKSLQIVPNIDRNLPPLLGDKRVLNQILMNLCSNALKFTHQGFIRLTAEGVQTSESEIRVRFSVEDTGIGIPDKAHHKIFQHFTQADSSITRRYGGTGLGLAITKQVIEHLGGSIGFESAENQGTTFWFELSYLIADTVPEYDTDEHTICASAPLDILLVEDTPINQEVTRGLLESDGHTVSIADDGFTALSMHNDHAYDLVLMDIHLPDMDGIETTKRMRSHPDSIRAAVKIVALTASVAQHEIESYLASGMDDALAKPIQYKDLQNLISKQHSITPIQDNNHPLIDHSLLNQHKEMLGEDSLNALLIQYDNQAEKLFEEMQQAMQESNLLDVGKKAHTLSGAAANFGFIAVQMLAKEIESSMSQANIQTASGSQLEENMTHLKELLHLSKYELEHS